MSRSTVQPISPSSPDGETEWSAEDDARVLAMLDDGTKASIATMFMGREQNDAITMDQLMEMMSEIQVTYDPDFISKIVPEETWDNLTLTQCYVIIARFIEMAQRHVAEQVKAESAVLVTQAATPVVYLNTVQYLIHLLPCSVQEDGVEYRWTKVQFDVRPKTILMVSVAAMMVISAVTLIAVVIALNEHVAAHQKEATIEAHGHYASLAASAILDTGTMHIAAGFLKETSAAVARVIDAIFIARQRIVMDRMQQSLWTLRAAFAAHVDQLWSRQEELLRHRAQILQNLFRDHGSANGVRNILSEWSSEAASVLFDRDRVVVHSTLSCVTPGETWGLSPCTHASFSDKVMFGESVTICGESRFAFASVPLSRLGLRACLMVSHETIVNDVAETVDESITELNRLRLDSSVEAEVALVVPGGAQLRLLGGRKSLPALCTAGSGCAESMELFALARNNTTPGTAVVIGYDNRYWLSSFASVKVRGVEFLMGLKEDVGDDLSAFYDSLPSLNRHTGDNSSEPAVLLAVGDHLERVLLLPRNSTTTTTVQEQYFGFALHGRSGITLPSFDNPESIMAGYAPVSAAEMAVGLQLRSGGVSRISLALLLAVLEEQNRSLPPDTEILVFSQPSPGVIESLMEPKTPCSGRCRLHTAAATAFTSESPGVVVAVDHAGRQVLAWHRSFLLVPPVVVIVQVADDRSEALSRRYAAIGAGCAIIVAVQLVILALTRRVLDRIENDYNRYKRHIEDEKHQFSELVKDVMPPYIAERIMKGSRLIAETHPQLTFFFSDIVGSTETTKTMTNKQLVRMLGYTFMLEDEIASKFRVHKIKTIGDAYFAVAGLEDSVGGAATGKEHQVYRMVSFACITQQLFGPAYAHFPERTECFRISANGQDLGPMKMTKMRMGIHTGPAVAGVVDVGRAPHFDAFGPSVNLASRMESTSTAGRVQVSGPTMEILAKLDKEGLFEFEPPRKTLVKGYGTMITYLIKSTNLHVPEELISKLHIERAKRRQYFAGDLRHHKNSAAAPGGKKGTSTPSRSDRGSDKPMTPRGHGDAKHQPESDHKGGAGNRSHLEETTDEDYPNQEEGIASLLPGMLPVSHSSPLHPNTMKKTKNDSKTKERDQQSEGSLQSRQSSRQATHSSPPAASLSLPTFGGLQVSLPPPPPPSF